MARLMRLSTPRTLALLLPGLLVAVTASAQQPRKLEDNSFLVEEAYNQEPRVVQHIVSGELHHGDAALAFSQEWPLGGERWQGSYTLTGVQDGGLTLGDAEAAVRWQALAGVRGRLFAAPKLGLLIPVGDADRRGGNGGWGLSAVLPVSWEVASRLTIHGNLGADWRPAAENATGDQAGTLTPMIGVSAMFFVTPMLNLIAESAWEQEATVTGAHQTARAWEQAVTLGARYGFNLPGGTQIVPGAAWMPAVGDAATRSYLYLSVEHPF
jgi:hypothetical protein